MSFAKEIGKDLVGNVIKKATVVKASRSQSAAIINKSTTGDTRRIKQHPLQLA
jgi:hypothetical protein